MFGFLMTLFVITSLFLALIILVQQGKGDMGLGSLGGSTQTLFGGSGGQGFFEKLTWFLCAIFLLGSLGLSLLKSKEIRKSSLEGYTVQKTQSAAQPSTPTSTDIKQSVAPKQDKDKSAPVQATSQQKTS